MGGECLPYEKRHGAYQFLRASAIGLIRTTSARGRRCPWNGNLFHWNPNMEKTETFAKSPSLTHFFAIRFIICAFCDASEVLQRSKVWKSTALFTLFGFWMQTNLAGFAGCQECRKARRSRMVLDNLRKLLNHHAAKKRKLGSLKKCKQRDLFQQLLLWTVLKSEVLQRSPLFKDKTKNHILIKRYCPK